MVDEADTVLTSTNILHDDRKRYDQVVAKLDAFFKVRTNVIYKCAKFNLRDQREGESVEQYIPALYELVESFEYGELKDEMLRDRIVIEIRNSGLSECLQINANLTLDRTKRAVRQKEAVHEQTMSLQGDGSKQNPVVVDELKGRHKRKTISSGGRNASNSIINLCNVHVAGVKNMPQQTSVLHRKPAVINIKGKGIIALCGFFKNSCPSYTGGDHL